MPIYEYECGICRSRFEMKQGFDEAPKAMCPHCQGRARRVLHSTPIIFRGSGFYVTDTRKDPDTATSPKSTAIKPKDTATKPKDTATKPKE